MAATPNSIITPQIPNSGVTTAHVLLSTAMAAASAFNGTSVTATDTALIFTAGANGSQLSTLRVRFSQTASTAPSGSTTASVIRVWLNNGSTNATAANNLYYDDVALPVTLYSSTASMATYTIDFKGLVIPAGWKVYAGLVSTLTLANAAVHVSMPGGGDL